MLKHLIIIICFTTAVCNAEAQSINYNQLQRLFTIWMNSKGKSTTTLTTQLKSISPKWKLLNTTAQVDGATKYYAWSALDATSDSTIIAVYIDEDNESTKYTLRYAHHSKGLYNTMGTALRASSYYAKGRITTFRDNSKNEFTLNGFPDETLPMPQRIDILLSSYELNVSAAHPALYTVDIYSRYIPKHN
jgi:hypothetical protein